MSKTPESLDAYLHQIERELRELPATARAEEVREIEAHLGALIKARQLAGADNATAAALTQFGKPRKVGRDLRRAWERKQPEAWWRPLLAVLFGMAAKKLFGVVQRALGGFYLDIHNINYASPVLIGEDAQTIFASFLLYQQVAGILATFVVGYTIGLICQRRAILAASATIVLSFLPGFFQSFGFIETFGSIIIWRFATIFLMSLGIACCGAYLGARHSRKRRARIANAQ